MKAMTSAEYWNAQWGRAGRVRGRLWAADPAVRQQAAVIVDLVRRARPHGRPRILEVGCANSAWLPWLAKEMGAEVTGVDFSRQGCRLARERLADAGVKGTVVRADFFRYAPPRGCGFDLVISFGFIEHFDEPWRVLARMRRIVRPGGSVFATVPYMHGIYLPLQRLLNPVPLSGYLFLTRGELEAAARKAGLVRPRVYWLGGAVWFSVLNLDVTGPAVRRSAYRFLRRALFVISIAVGRCLEAVRLNLNQPVGSPYLAVEGFRPRRGRR